MPSARPGKARSQIGPVFFHGFDNIGPLLGSVDRAGENETHREQEEVGTGVGGRPGKRRDGRRAR